MKKNHLKLNLEEIHYLEFKYREQNFTHHLHEDDMLQYELLRAGNPAAIVEAKKMFLANVQGHLSDDPVRNLKYMMVAATTLACRFAIEGGVECEFAHNASDLYIQKTDLCTTIEEITALEADMFTFFTMQVKASKKQTVYSKPIIKCMDYINNHLDEPIHAEDLALYVDLSESYLSSLFKKEVGSNITSYILESRISTAKNMLKYTNYSFVEISNALAFSSQSYFGQQFKKITGYSPKQYRTLFFQKSLGKER